MSPAPITGCGGEDSYDRAADVKQFDDSKLGVKGLVDSGITSIPRFFIHPPETISDLGRRPVSPDLADIIPIIDLSGDRAAVVEQMARASRELGFFQIVNHGIPVDDLDHILGFVKAFHEQPPEVKTRFHGRDDGCGFIFFSNLDLHLSKAASWRDTLRLRLSPKLPDIEEIPEIRREDIVGWNEQYKQLGENLMGLLCEGLGLHTNKLKNMNCSEARMMVGQYYPWCPQPNMTLGINSHTDIGLLTILLQDCVGGLQIKHGENWLDVKPVPGALVINIGDILQIMSNDEYKSVEHRVLANPFPEPRISAAVFFHASDQETLYGPFPEILTVEKPARFRQFHHSDYMKRYFTKELDGKSLINYYRL